jgi:RHS repeat-associated protein
VVTDTYDYDAFGNLLHSTATGIPPGGTTVAPTPNEFLFAGEQFDPDLNLYYNRARYLNVSTGRFWTMDDYEGDDEAPLSLHKYLYVAANPTNLGDPSGHDFDLVSFAISVGISGVLNAIPAVVGHQTLKQVAKDFLIGSVEGQHSSLLEALLLNSLRGQRRLPPPLRPSRLRSSLFQAYFVAQGHFMPGFSCQGTSA